MATDLGRVKSAPSNKYDAFVASQLARAESRIRLLDLTAGLLGFAALGLAYIVGMVLCDSKLEMTPHTRQLSLYAFLAVGAAYLFFLVWRPLRLRVNPYYAARQVEQQLPEAKNSIVNWVDLHAQPLPPAIRGALGQRAAKDLSRVDLDRVISGRRAAWMGGLAGAGLAAFIVSFFLLGPSPFFSLLHRAFNPFGQVGVSTRTQLSILRPEGGNAVVTVGRGINLVVEVTGKVPDPKAADAVKLLYRYEETDPWLERLLVREANHEWTTALSAIEVKNGFWYLITGGDAATEEYRVSVRAAPALTDFLATYRYRRYVARADDLRHERELKALRGTEVRLRVRTNRALREARLEYLGENGSRTERGRVDPDDPHVFQVIFLLDQNGKYRLHFTSTDSEAYSDADAHPITAVPDQPPTVELTKPGRDVELPADALLRLEGRASDDVGVKSVELHLQVVGGEKLQGKPYRPDERMRLADGGYPREVEYQAHVELANVRTPQGQAFPVRGGMELEYWLEAADACDYPQANVTRSKTYRVRLIEPEKNAKKAQQEKQKAEQERKQHEEKQDQKRQQEQQQRQQERKEQEARNQEEQARSNEANPGNAGEQAPPKKDEKQEHSDDQNQGGTGENKPSKEEQELENKVKEALEKKDQNENGQGEAKPDRGDEGEGKGAQDSKPEGADKSDGEGKDRGQQGTDQPGEGKDSGKPQPGGDAAQGDGKGDSQPQPMPGDRSEAKGGGPMNQPGAGEAGEGKGKPEQAPPQSGEGKGSGNPQDSKDAGQAKPQPMGQGADASAQGDSKPADAKDPQATGEGAAEAKGNPDGGTSRGEAKAAGENKDESRGEAKQGGTAPMGEPSAQGDPKPSGGTPGGDKTAQAEAKPDAGAQARNATGKDVDELAKQLHDRDAQKRAEAKKELEQILQGARDPEARASAEEALDQAGQPDGPAHDRPAQPGSGQGDGTPTGEGKNGKSDGSRDTGTSKPGGGEKGQADSEGKNGERGAPGQHSGSPRGNAKDVREGEGGNTPGGGGTRRTGDSNAGGPGDASAEPHKPSKPRAHRTAQLQLEDFMKKVDKKVLKEAGVSEEAWKKYLQARRKQLATPEAPHAEAPAAPQQARTLPSIGPRPLHPAAPGQSSDVQAPDRGQPPPGYRDPFRAFTRQMTK